MNKVCALIPCSHLRRHIEDWDRAIYTLLSLPHEPGQIAAVDKEVSFLVWLDPESFDETKWTRIHIPNEYAYSSKVQGAAQ